MRGTMYWDALRNYIAAEVVPHSSAAPKVHGWINSLQPNIDHTLLAACIGVDLLSGAIEPHRFAGILDEVDPATSDPCDAFDEALEKHSGRKQHVCSSRHPRPSLGSGDFYVRVLTMAEFITYYAGPVYGYTLNVAHVAEVRRSFLSGTGSTTLEDIDRWWEGGLPSVWVTAESELDAI